MAKGKNSGELITFDKKIKEISDAKNLVIAEREQVKNKLVEAINQDLDSTELYEDYRIKGKEIDGYDEKIKFFESKRAEIRNMPIYRKTQEGQEAILAGDEVYEFLKKKNNTELLKALMDRKLTVDQYMTLYYTGLTGDQEGTAALNENLEESRIVKLMKAFKSGTASLEIKVGEKGKGRGIKVLNNKGDFETIIGEEYILARLSRYFSRTGITLNDLKATIKFPGGVQISRPEDTEIKFKCENVEGTIKVKFTIQESETTSLNTENLSQTDSLHSNDSDFDTESREKLPEKDASPKQLFDSLEQYVKGRVGGDLSSADIGDIEAALELLKEEETYKQFCGMSKGEKVLNDPEINFPSSFEDFLNKIAPIELNEKQLIAVLQSNYRRKGDGKNSRKVLVFDTKCFRDCGDHQDYVEKYCKHNDYRNNYTILDDAQKEEYKNLKIEISKIERDIIDKYYPHLKEVYFKDKK